MDIIKIEQLKFSYDKKEILKGINLLITEKKLTGILGPNGCGRTTLLKNILGYLKAEKGEIFLRGRKSTEFSKREKAKFMSFVPQKSQIVSGITVEEFVFMGRLPHLKNSWDGYSEKDKKIAERYLKELKLEKFREDVLGSLVINIEEDKQELVTNYLNSTNIKWEVI